MANYRQQVSGNLGSVSTCPSCFSQLTLCYSTTEEGLCCGTPSQSIVYVAGAGITTLANVTGLLYTTSDLTTQAADGYYSDDPDINCSTVPISVAINANASNNPITYDNDGDACGAGVEPGLFTVYTGADQTAPEAGMVLYTDSNLTNAWDGGDEIYKIISFNANLVNYVADIDAAGVLGTQTADCS